MIGMISEKEPDRIRDLLKRYLTIFEANVDDRNDFGERKVKLL